MICGAQVLKIQVLEIVMQDPELVQSGANSSRALDSISQKLTSLRPGGGSSFSQYVHIIMCVRLHILDVRSESCPSH